MTQSKKPAPRKASPLFRGTVVGIGLAAPLAVIATALLANCGIGDPAASITHLARLATVFALLPAALVTAGVARMTARAAHGRARRVAIAACIPASTGFILLVALPVGGLPEQPTRWLWLVAAGAAMALPLGSAIARALQPGWGIPWRAHTVQPPGEASSGSDSDSNSPSATAPTNAPG